MKIKSRFKDYYDHVAHQYGGGDPKVVYNREPLLDVKLTLDIESKDNQVFSALTHFSHFVPFVDYKLVCAAGKVFLTLSHAPFAQPQSPFELFREDNFHELHQHWFGRRRYYRASGLTLADFVNSEMPCLVDISKKVNAPVFSINRVFSLGHGKWRLFLDKNIPIMEDYGIASVVKPEQMYQDVGYFLANTMRDSPDMMPPTVSTDKEKVLQHGFDVKQSFRHRK